MIYEVYVTGTTKVIADAYNREEAINKAQEYCDDYCLGGEAMVLECELVISDDDKETSEDIMFYPTWDENEVSDYGQHCVWNKTQTGCK